MADLNSKKGFFEFQGADLYYEVAGQGHPLLLIHAGIADNRMWDQQFEVFASRYRVIRYDLRGYGQSVIPAGKFAYHEDPTLLLKEQGIERAHVLGVSFGGKVALDFTLSHPEMVSSLVLVAPSASGSQESADVVQFGDEEDALVERGELDAATELNLRMWVDGPQRTPEQVDPNVRRFVGEMTRQALANPTPEQAELLKLDPPANERLHEIQVPTLLIVGDYDIPSKIQQAQDLAKRIAGARYSMLRGGGHAVTMEQPEAFNRLVLEFLGQVKG